ncbi:hypothetical protein Baya_16469 [Bagarius yarrelli]|uniref:Uncharacterized protein n=1 Tax=Bagarius yarrelli TaxID=175774 RepID=A0A556VVR8_BAGYA|nr:hypothetical protein Baya_16469 [Bagarius yarrelli]
MMFQSSGVVKDFEDMELGSAEEEAEEEDRLAEEAQRRFDNQQHDKDQSPAVEQPEGTRSYVNMSFEVEQESSS